MWPNPQEAAYLVTFTKEIPNEKLHFLCRVTYSKFETQFQPVLWQCFYGLLQINVIPFIDIYVKLNNNINFPRV